jgi:hypothetical protein
MAESRRLPLSIPLARLDARDAAAPGRGTPLVLVPTAEGVERIRGEPTAVALHHLLTIARPAGAPQPAWPTYLWLGNGGSAD